MTTIKICSHLTFKIVRWQVINEDNRCQLTIYVDVIWQVFNVSGDNTPVMTIVVTWQYPIHNNSCHLTTDVCVRWQVINMSGDNIPIKRIVVRWQHSYLSPDKYSSCHMTQMAPCHTCQVTAVAAITDDSHSNHFTCWQCSTAVWQGRNRTLPKAGPTTVAFVFYNMKRNRCRRMNKHEKPK